MASGVERSRSVSSMRSTKTPAWRRAYNQQNSAVRNPPMCRKPVGLGAKRVRTIMDVSLEKQRAQSLADPPHGAQTEQPRPAERVCLGAGAMSYFANGRLAQR